MIDIFALQQHKKDVLVERNPRKRIGLEVWIDIETYPNASEFKKIVAAIGGDKDFSAPLIELDQIMAARRLAYGEFKESEEV